MRISPAAEAEARQLTERARALWGQSTAMTVAEYEALGLTARDVGPDDCCDAGKPLRRQADEMRARAYALRNGSAVAAPTITSSLHAAVPHVDAPRAVAPVPAAPPPQPPMLSREEALRSVAAVSPLPLPACMLAAALSSGQCLDAFAASVRCQVDGARAAAREDLELTAAALGILASADGLPPPPSPTQTEIEKRAAELSVEHRYAPQPSGVDDEIEAAVARILAA